MKALIGSWDNRPYQLLAEATALRTRVRDLEARVAALQTENDSLREALHEHDLQVVLTTS